MLCSRNLEAFPRALESAKAEEKKNPDASWRNALLSWASTTVGSLKDLLKEAPWYVKNVLTLFKEASSYSRPRNPLCPVPALREDGADHELRTDTCVTFGWHSRLAPLPVLCLQTKSMK